MLPLAVVGITTGQVREGAVRAAEAHPQTLPVAPEEHQHSRGPLGWSAVPLSLCPGTTAQVAVARRMTDRGASQKVRVKRAGMARKGVQKWIQRGDLRYI